MIMTMKSATAIILVTVLLVAAHVHGDGGVITGGSFRKAGRVRRDDAYAAASSTLYSSYGKGPVGPVYTFAKSDPKANFKWGVRHRAGV